MNLTRGEGVEGKENNAVNRSQSMIFVIYEKFPLNILLQIFRIFLRIAKYVRREKIKPHVKKYHPYIIEVETCNKTSFLHSVNVYGRSTLVFANLDTCLNPFSLPRYTDKKENQIFLIYAEIQIGSGAKSFMRKGVKGLLIYEEMRKYLTVYEEAVSHI